MLSHLLAAGTWILKTPLALFVIVAGLALDSVARLFLTFSSSYFRLIGLPTASYGMLGAMMGLIGLVVSPVARRMVLSWSPAGNFGWLAVLSLVGLVGLAAQWPFWGVIFALPVVIVMSAVSYQVSYYLNAAVESRQRATVLSFKGLAFNLGYGFASLAFAAALRSLRGSGSEAFGRTLPWLPVWLGVLVILVVLGFYRHRALLGGRNSR